MPEDRTALGIAREWAAKADNDLLAARHLLRLEKKCPTDTVSFHAQQCVEKYLKAALVVAGVDFPKAHDLQHLAGLLPPDMAAPLTS